MPRSSTTFSPGALPATHRNNRLTLSQHLFINAYLDTMKANGGDPHGCARKAYRHLHPRSTPESADVSASRLLAMDKVKEEIARRVRHQEGITLELVTSDLLTAHEIALKQGRPDVIASVAMDCAKLAGFLIEKRQDVSQQLPALSEEQIWNELARRMKVHESSTTRTGAPTDREPVSVRTTDAVPSASTENV